MRIEIEPGEWWWGGAVADGTLMPFGAAPHRRDLATNAGLVDDPTAGANQSAPLLVSSHGRYVWSDEPFTFAFDGEGGLEVERRRWPFDRLRERCGLGSVAGHELGRRLPGRRARPLPGERNRRRPS